MAPRRRAKRFLSAEQTHARDLFEDHYRGAGQPGGRGAGRGGSLDAYGVAQDRQGKCDRDIAGVAAGPSSRRPGGQRAGSAAGGGRPVVLHDRRGGDRARAVARKIGLGLSGPVPKRSQGMRRTSCWPSSTSMWPLGGRPNARVRGARSGPVAVSFRPPTPGAPPDDPRPTHRPETAHDAVWFSSDLSCEGGNASAVDHEPRLGCRAETDRPSQLRSRPGHSRVSTGRQRRPIGVNRLATVDRRATTARTNSHSAHRRSPPNIDRATASLWPSSRLDRRLGAG